VNNMHPVGVLSIFLVALAFLFLFHRCAHFVDERDAVAVEIEKR